MKRQPPSPAEQRGGEQRGGWRQSDKIENGKTAEPPATRLDNIVDIWAGASPLSQHAGTTRARTGADRYSRSEFFYEYRLQP